MFGQTVERRVDRADRAAHENALRANLLSFETTKARHAGNDPDAERHDPELWTDVHHELISQIQTALNRVLCPHHVARVQVRTYFADDAPRQEIKEGRIEIRPHHSAEVLTVIEILSDAKVEKF